MTLNPAPEAIPGIRRRFIVVSLIAATVFGVLALRLWHLQVLGFDHYRQLSERNRIRYVNVEPPRGILFDRHGTLLVDNRPAFTVSALRQEIDDRPALFARLAALLGLEPAVIEERWQAGKALPHYRPLPLLSDVGREAMEKVQENSVDLPGILVEVKPLRNYPRGAFAAHLFGYLGEMTEEELRSEEFSAYRSGDMIGKTALERLLEKDLHGQAGLRRIEVNVKGRELRQVTTRDPLPGNNVYTTIDANLQAAAEQAFGEQAGAAVALDVHTGEVLALVSQPAFDPAHFARGISSEEWLELVNNPQDPLQNKVLRGQYPPGSTFKVAVALAALDAGVAGAGTSVECYGKFSLGSHDFRCWKKEGHGHTDLHKALKESCDVWFYRVGLDLGIERIAAAAHKLGLGQPLGFPFGNERGGLIPDRQWKKQRFGTGWYDGETVIAAIGQGFVLTTPLQLAAMTAAVANGGTVWKPQVVKRIENLAGETIWASEPEILSQTAWSEAQLRLVRKAMEGVVNEPGGTAYRSQLRELRFAGKTGTAQVVRKKDDEEEDLQGIPYRFRDHALFVAFAPADRPQIAVAVVVEHGGHGSSAAAPVAKAMFQAYFGLVPQTPPPAEGGTAEAAAETASEPAGD